ncbi:hypothetical protein SSS_06043 [Sarcoptes scabiei]|uniref:Uncharacterized protein n=1 Tax=Sarcoptes scabiei TaxID=52283 RepID=A0A834V9A4_SARSC|nr:hypothetical protein SSS_06043 [Sarcoptes scabiei]
MYSLHRFVLLRDEGQEIEPRIERSMEIISERTHVPYMERPQHFSPVPFKPPIYNQHPNDMIIAESIISTAAAAAAANPQPQLQPQQPSFTQPNQQQSVPIQQGSGPRKPDTRVFGINPRSPSKSPIRLNHSVSMQPSPQAQQNQQPYYQQPPQSQTVNFRTSQSTPTTPTALNRNFDFPVNDSNNNPMRDDRKVFGVQNRGPNSQPIQPMGNHGVQPALNEKRVFGLNVRQRFNSISSDRDWNEALPIVNIPNTDQLLPSQTRQMQTYINQTPPTEKNLRPSLASLQRRKIRPMWPPPSPRINRGTFAEGRESPSTRACNWPPSRSQSVERDFGYGERSSESPFYNFGRVRKSSQVWPPPSNATPAGASGYIPDENDAINYAYNPSREQSPAPGWITSHIPTTYRPPPGTQFTQLINDF